MTIALSVCKQALTQFSFPSGDGIHIESYSPRRWKEKVVVVLIGATGTGKSRLSIDLATHFSAEVINSDKMQVYRGLDIVTNKITDEERRGVPHHLLGVVDPEAEFTALDFRCLASLSVESITNCGKLPIIAGGSNSYIQALVTDEFRSKYKCCFLWVDVMLPVLSTFVSERVDRMVEAGLVEEVRKIFHIAGAGAGAVVDYSRGIRRAIGVPELDQYLQAEASNADEDTRARMLDVAIEDIKVHTCNLARFQLEKIHQLRTRYGWDINRIDATDVFLKHGKEADRTWEKSVKSHSIDLVEKFLWGEKSRDAIPSTMPTTPVEAVLATT